MCSKSEIYLGLHGSSNTLQPIKTKPGSKQKHHVNYKSQHDAKKLLISKDGNGLLF